MSKLNNERPYLRDLKIDIQNENCAKKNRSHGDRMKFTFILVMHYTCSVQIISLVCQMNKAFFAENLRADLII